MGSWEKSLENLHRGGQRLRFGEWRWGSRGQVLSYNGLGFPRGNCKLEVQAHIGKRMKIPRFLRYWVWECLLRWRGTIVARPDWGESDS
jgi:hypothetical protein